jgi:hypothetical protein
MSLGNFTEMIRDIDEAFSLLRQEKMEDMVGRHTFAQACWQIAMQLYPEALRTLHEAGQTFRKLGGTHGLTQTIAMLAYVVYRLGRPTLAQAYALATLRSASALQLYLPIAFVLPTIALLLLDQGELERATELYALAERHAYVGKSRYFAQLAGNTMAAAAQQAPTMAAAAADRGQTLDLWQTAHQLLTELPNLGWDESGKESIAV